MQCPVFSGLNGRLTLFVLGVGAFFFFLPLRTDATATILTMTLTGIWAAWGSGAFTFLRTGPWRVPLLAFAVFIAIAFVASACNPPTLAKFPRILLWGCCVFSGALLSFLLPRHGGAYFWATVAAIVGSLAVGWLLYGHDAPRLWQEDRLKLFAIHPSRLALYCAVCFFFLLHRAVAAGKRERLLSLAGALLLLFLDYKTNTRGNFLLLPVGVVCLAVTFPRRHWKRLAVVGLLCLAVGISFPWLTKDSPASARVLSAVTSLSADKTFKSRLPIWEAGWDAFTRAPVIGHGIQSYRALHADYLEANKADWDARYKDIYEPSVKQAHNLILGRLVETGVLGTAAFLLFYLGAIVAAWRGREENRWVVAPLIFYLAMSMFDDGLFRMNDALILFAAGSALGYAPANGVPEAAPR